MSVEERLRATTEAVTGAMRPVRPLDLTPAAISAAAEAGTPAERRPARPVRPARLSRPPRRWSGWLAPAAAAVAAVAVAATLVAVRDVSGNGVSAGSGATASAPAAAPAAGGVPRYYVSQTIGGNGSLPTTTVFVGDSRTGKRVATFKAPAGIVYGYVAGSDDDRTFVVSAQQHLTTGPTWSWHLVWYVIRLSPGASPKATLSRIPVAATFTTGAMSGLVVSPDGRSFAFASRSASASSGTVTSADLVTLRTYSVATGRLQHTWTAPPSQRNLYAFGDFSWLDDGHTLAFAYPADSLTRQVRTLDTRSPGTSLLADSKAVFSVPGGHACNDNLLMTGDGKSVICGIFGTNNGWCTTGQLTLSAYSVATGKLERVLYRYQGKCEMGFTMAVWARSASVALAVITIGTVPKKPPVPGPIKVTVGVVTPGKFTPLPVTLSEPLAGEAPGAVAF